MEDDKRQYSHFNKNHCVQRNRYIHEKRCRETSEVPKNAKMGAASIKRDKKSQKKQAIFKCFHNQDKHDSVLKK